MLYCQVLLPVAPDTQVPEWFFERTPADVKAEYVSIRKAREEGQQFKLRPKQEEREAAKEVGRVATVRVRFPEVGRGMEGVSGVCVSCGVLHVVVKGERERLVDTLQYCQWHKGPQHFYCFQQKTSGRAFGDSVSSRVDCVTVLAFGCITS
jgi:hypothetical protein